MNLHSAIPVLTVMNFHHGLLGGHADAHRCCEKSLIGTALVGFSVRQQARAESISKHARPIWTLVLVEPRGRERRPSARAGRLSILRDPFYVFVVVGYRRSAGALSTPPSKSNGLVCANEKA